MRDNFRQPLGGFAVAGLDFLPLWLYLRREAMTVGAPLAAAAGKQSAGAGAAARAAGAGFGGGWRSLVVRAAESKAVGATLCAGRLTAAAVETWVLWCYFEGVLASDHAAWRKQRWTRANLATAGQQKMNHAKTTPS